ACDVELLGAVDPEAHAPAKAGGQRRARLGNAVLVRVEGIDRRGLLGGRTRQAAGPAAHVEHALAAKLDELLDQARLGVVRVALLYLPSSCPPQPRVRHPRAHPARARAPAHKTRWGPRRPRTPPLSARPWRRRPRQRP